MQKNPKKSGYKVDKNEYGLKINYEINNLRKILLIAAMRLD